MMIPSIGRIVHYTLDEQDVGKIKNGRLANPERLGNFVEPGQVCPMLIVRCWGTMPESLVNGQVFLDGNDTLWVTSVGQGDGERQWREPSRTLENLT